MVGTRDTRVKTAIRSTHRLNCEAATSRRIYFGLLDRYGARTGNSPARLIMMVWRWGGTPAAEQAWGDVGVTASSGTRQLGGREGGDRHSVRVTSRAIMLLLP